MAAPPPTVGSGPDRPGHLALGRARGGARQGQRGRAPHGAVGGGGRAGLDDRGVARPQHGGPRVAGLDDRLSRDRVARRGERPAHLARVGVASGGVLGERVLHDLDEGRRDLGRPLADRVRLLLEDLEEHPVHGVRLEGPVVREQLVEDRAQGEHVRARVGLLAAHLLGGHVVRRAHHRARPRHVGGAEAGEAEVEDLDLAVGLEVHVAGLEVAVDDSLRVREAEAVAQLLHDGDLVAEGALPRPDDVLEVLPLEELHGHVGEAVLFAEVEDGDDVRVVELGRRLGFPQEAAAEVGIGGEGGGDRLDGDEPVEERVLGLVDLAHRPLADLPDHAVLADSVEVHHRPAPPGVLPGPLPCDPSRRLRI